ncbi:hypothetical protein N9937_02075 [bacterium]|nr:hypothetical protein [bacterium]
MSRIIDEMTIKEIIEELMTRGTSQDEAVVMAMTCPEGTHVAVCGPSDRFSIAVNELSDTITKVLVDQLRKDT